MKIAIPVDRKENGKISENFGRSEYFMFIDLESGINEVLLNPAFHSSGGAGVKAAQFVIDNGANVAIMPRGGQNAASLLQETNIKLFKSIGNSVDENIKKYQDNLLQELDTIHEGFHNHGGH
jgi:predicted Fe-Mo cluster-binding NifX family protein